ncbi:hypothetical protein HMPREF0208_02513 [Citrobacter koseri]|uniref:Uncharacterized protein n=1 Tax=Citrobacter koseri (strain ATCC BAA-895 / CDC 4225-83 / SGSC4696) TaxID=290338 RepID=A8AMM2_CITK8|nr:hypothetical protein CKO_03656 [Citrobacter koseri ATCC BAA-895]KWZ97662.1 hypothetical protein HMPREF3220_03033 [Citrobacter koseri]KXA01524.1 hypothetical protein HMPREF3207_02821 [Citrobacter koseri]KXB43761.1 hypothetical protein HMPREF0208_02513 [Citrobacter koseri]
MPDGAALIRPVHTVGRIRRFSPPSGLIQRKILAFFLPELK